MYRTTIEVDGMHCSMCESNVKGILMNLYPDASIKASHRKGTVTIEDSFIPSKTDLSRALGKGGYEIKHMNSEKFEKKPGLFSRLFMSLKSA